MAYAGALGVLWLVEGELFALGAGRGAALARLVWVLLTLARIPSEVG